MIVGPQLYIFGGLPGCGKTTVARELAAVTGACNLRIDTIEQALIRTGLCTAATLEGNGYLIAVEIAADQLKNHLSVIADCVNPLELTRNWWRQAAAAAGCRAVEVEFICSNAELHRLRAETRTTDIPGMKLPEWEEILRREYECWRHPHLVIDTATTSVSEAVELLIGCR